jgi:hypothetical protein
MRSNTDIDVIKSRTSDPISVANFLSKEEIAHLIAIFNQHESGGIKAYDGLVEKITGPITLNLETYRTDPVIIKIMHQLEKEIGKFEMTAGFFFRTDFPHIIHNDDTHELPSTVYKGITLPLELNGFNGAYPKLCFFDQFYFHGPAKFFKGSKDIPTYYNKQIYNYEHVDGLSSAPFVGEYSYFTHLYPQWLEGLSFHSAVDWIPGNAIIFDSTRLHCASDFRSLGIKSKLAISIFTKVV